MGKARKTALVIEDDPDTLLFMANALSSKYNVQTALSRDAAIESVRQAMPDLIVVDYQMPGMDTYSFMRRVWRLAPLLPVMIISAYEDGGAVSKRLGLPFLRKPFDADGLHSFVAAHTNSAH
jgi:CheY-like chemotaxis protein